MKKKHNTHQKIFLPLVSDYHAVKCCIRVCLLPTPDSLCHLVSGIVKFLIIDGDNRIQDENDDDDADSNYGHGILEEKPHPLSFSKIHGRNRVSFSEQQADDVSVALLHVSYRSGYELTEVVMNENKVVRQSGGTRVALDNASPSSSHVLLFLWIGLCVIIACSACCGLSHAIANLLETNQVQNDQPQHRRPRRRRLTLNQVQRIQVGVFDGSHLIFKSRGDESDENDVLHPSPVPSLHCLESCTICLDDYVLGDKLRMLECSHAFHSTCIAKWLTERSATCPLCKINLFEDDDEQIDNDDFQGNTRNEEQQRRGIGFSGRGASIPPSQTEEAISQNERSWTEYWRRWVNFRGSIHSLSPLSWGRRRSAAQGSESLAEPLLNQELDGVESSDMQDHVSGVLNSFDEDISVQGQEERLAT